MIGGRGERRAIRDCNHVSRHRATAWSLLGSLAFSVLVATHPCCGAEIVVVRAQRVYVGNGEVVEDGMVLLEDGRVKEVGTGLTVPEGATMIEVPQGCVTPGLIDANARVGMAELITPTRAGSRLIPESSGDLPPLPEVPLNAPTDDDSQAMAGREPDDAAPGHVPEEGEDDEHPHDDAFAIGVPASELINEQSSEVVPHTRVVDAMNWRAGDFERLVRGGVTTVYVSPDPTAVIGARGAVLRTAGEPAHRVLVPAAAVKATIGSEPSRMGQSNRTPSRTAMSMYARRPISRMGLVWVFRKAFYDTQRRAMGLDVYGADAPSDEAMDVLREVLAGAVPLRIQARLQRDITTALRLADEFQLDFVLEEATEAYLCLDELQARQVPVVFGPIYETPSGVRVRSGEGNRSRYFTFRALVEAGIPTALSAQEFRDEAGLARQAMYALRFGLALDDALAAVTRTPAKLIGLDDQIGTLQAGKRGDLVVWSGPPLAATSRIVMVMIDGNVVVDHR